MKYVVYAVILAVCGIRVLVFYLPNSKLVNGQRLKIRTKIEEIYVNSRFQRYFYVDRLKILVPSDIEANSGDIVEFFGTVKTTVIDNSIVNYGLTITSFQIIDTQPSLKRFTGNIRDVLITSLLRQVPGNEGALFSGIVLGGDMGMTWHMREMFRTVGLSHIVAASGYNLSVVAVMMQLIINPLIGRQKSIYFVILCTILYALIAGLGAPIIRAAIMTTCTLAAMLIGRRQGGIWMLFLSCSGMIMYHPQYIKDISFQLSSAATLGVLVSTRFSSSKSLLKNELKTGLWASTLILPISLFHFGTFAWMSPFLTVIVTLLVPFIMEIALISIFAGLVIEPVGGALALLSWPLLKIITLLVETVSRFTWVSVAIPFGWPAVLISYLGIAIFVVWRGKKSY